MRGGGERGGERGAKRNGERVRGSSSMAIYLIHGKLFALKSFHSFLSPFS